MATQSTMESIELQDEGILPVKIKKLDGTEKVYNADLFAIKLAFEEVEQAHKVGKGYIATPEFLNDLVKAARRCGVECTPSVAFKLWPMVTERWISLKKSLEPTPSSPSSTESIPLASTELSEPDSTLTS